MTHYQRDALDRLLEDIRRHLDTIDQRLDALEREVGAERLNRKQAQAEIAGARTRGEVDLSPLAAPTMEGMHP